MTKLLAETGPSFTSGELASFLGIAVFILTLVVLVRKVFTRDPPLHQEYVNKAEHMKLEAKLDTELGRERGSRKQIYEKIEELGREFSKIASETRAQSKDLDALKTDNSEINSRIDAIPARTISLLRETQQLHSKH